MEIGIKIEKIVLDGILNSLAASFEIEAVETGQALRDPKTGANVHLFKCISDEKEKTQQEHHATLNLLELPNDNTDVEHLIACSDDYGISCSEDHGLGYGHTDDHKYILTIIATPEQLHTPSDPVGKTFTVLQQMGCIEDYEIISGPDDWYSQSKMHH